MCDSPSNGNFISADETRKDLAKALAKIELSKLKRAILDYELWLNDDYIDRFEMSLHNDIWREFIRKEGEEGMLKRLNGWLTAHDAICRELSRRWITGEACE